MIHKTTIGVAIIIMIFRIANKKSSTELKAKGLQTLKDIPVPDEGVQWELACVKKYGVNSTTAKIMDLSEDCEKNCIQSLIFFT